jgi:signal transduction histidine kinase/ActR/RegA family two-component response regulator
MLSAKNKVRLWGLLSAMLLIGVVLIWSINALRIGGDSYQKIISDKDLIADVLPPPLYVIESYLIFKEVLQAQHEAEMHQHSIDCSRLWQQIAHLEAEHAARVAYWQAMPLPSVLREQLQITQNSATQFYQLLATYRSEQQAGTEDEQRIAEVDDLYRQHRAAVEALVVASNVHYLQTKIEAEQILYRNMAIIIVLLIVVFWFVVSNWIALMKRSQRLREALSRAEDATVAKSNFLATMSHEIRTPMNGVLGMVHLLRDTTLSDEQKQLIAVLETSGKTLLSIINDILDFSKIEAGKLILEQREINLAQLLNEAADLFRGQVAEKGIRLLVQADANLPCAVLGDPVRLQQIVFNLLSNAIKFTRQGEVRLSLLATAQNDTYLIRVEDTGIGMSAKAQERLFTPFTQADASTTRKYGGTGLGLAICAKLVALMQGRIWVDSVLGEGSSVAFTFYAASVPDHDQKKQAQGDVVSASALSHLRVLLVEDNAINRLLAVKFLQRLAITPDTANDGLEALLAVQKQQYDVVLMDMQMPNMDGLTATRHIRAMTELKQPHIIALTANAFAEDKQACLDAGMNDFMSKPLNFASLQALLSAVVVSSSRP